MPSRLERALLGMILAGHVKLVDGDVWRWLYEQRKWIKKVPKINERGRSYYQFETGRNGSRMVETVMKSRLAWMIHNMKSIPDDCVVDHENGDRTCDHPDNLRLQDRTGSHRQGNGRASDLILERLCRWFEFVGEFGREPRTVKEESWVEMGF